MSEGTMTAEAVPRREDLRRVRVAQVLREAILGGDHPAGSLLPGENELARRFAVSRGTVRGALSLLARDRLIETRRGVGSFVAPGGGSRRRSFQWATADSADSAGRRMRVLRMDLLVDEELASEVGCPGSKFLALDRVRHVADGTPIALERSRTPAVGALADAPSAGLVGGSLRLTVAAAGLVPERGERWVSVVGLSAGDARVLGRRRGEPFLHSRLIARDADGAFVKSVSSLLDPERYRLHASFDGLSPETL